MARIAIVVAVLVLSWAPPGWSTIKVEGTAAFKKKVADTIAALKRNGNLQKGLIEGLENSTNEHKIKETKVKQGSNNSFDAKNGSNGKGTGSTTQWETTSTDKYDTDVNRDPKAALFHELVHASHADKGTVQKGVDKKSGIENEEVTTTKTENQERQSKGNPPRKKYGGKPLPS